MQSWVAVVLVALVVVPRLVLFAENRSRNPLADRPLVDAALHHEHALHVAHGELIADRPFERSPLYRYVIGGLYAALGPSPLSVAFFQLFLGLATLGLVYRITKRFTSSSFACIGVLLAGWYGPLAFLELKLLPATLACFLVTLGIDLLYRHLESGRAAGSAFAGLAGGLAVLARPNLLLLPVLLAAWLWRRRRASGLGYATGAAIALAAGYAHNVAAGGAGVFLTTGAGVNFYLGQRAGGEVSFTGGFEGASDAGQLQAASRAVYERETGGPPSNHRELESYWFRRGVAEIAGDPLAWVVLQGRKLLALASEFEYGVNAVYAAERSVLPALFAFWVPFAILFGLGVSGLFVARDSAPPRGPLACVLLAVVLSTLLFFTYSRFRAPAVPALAILATVAIDRVWRSLRGGSAVPAIRVGLASLGLAAASLLPPAPEASTQLAGGHALVGFAAFQDGDYGAAQLAYERALAADPTSTSTLQTLASVSIAAGNPRRAWDLYRDALATSPDSAAIAAQAALFLVASAPPDIGGDAGGGRAEQLARRAIELEPHLALPYAVLGMNETRRGNDAAALSHFDRARELSDGAAWLRDVIMRFLRANRAADLLRDLEGRWPAGASR